MTAYNSEIQLGQRYRDINTGFEGTATVVSFFQHGCDRLTIKGMNKQGEIVEYAFDSPEVELITADAPPQPVKSLERKTGGPHDRTPMSRR